MKKLISNKEFVLILLLSMSALVLLSRQDGFYESIFPSLSPGNILIFAMILGGGAGIAVIVSAAVYASRAFRRGWFLEIFKQTKLIRNEARYLLPWLKTEANAPGLLASLLLITAVGALVRAYFMSQPMRYDEAFTFMNFAREGRSVFFYRLPNNHVLHTILVRISVWIFGSGPAAIRLPSFLAGVMAIPAIYYLSRIISGSAGAGLLAAGIASVFPYTVLFDTMARGYSLVVLFSLLLAALALRFSVSPSRQLSFLIALITALGFFTMPSFLFLAAGMLCWLIFMNFLSGGSSLNFIRKYLIHGVLTTAALTFLIYLPVIIESRGIYNITRNRYVRSAPISDFVHAVPGHLSLTFYEFSRDIPRVLLAAFAVLFASGTIFFIRKKNFKAAVLLPSLAAGGAAVLFAVRAVPFPRTWIYLLPFIFIVVDAGFTNILKSYTRISAPVILFLTAVAGFVLINRNVIAEYPDTGHFPEAPAFAYMLAGEIDEHDELKVDCPADAPVYYYLWRQGARFKKSWMINDPRKTYFIVKPSIYTYPDIAEKDVTELLRFDDAGLYLRVND